MAAKLKDGVFLGDAEAAQDIDFLAANKILRIVNCCGRQAPNLYEAAGVRYLTYYWPESGNCIIFDESNAVLDEIYSFVEETVSLGLSVLIHSTDGVSRASFCAAIYFMLKYRWTLPKTLQYLQSKRPDLAPRPGFMRQLSALNESLQRVTRNAVGADDPMKMKRFTEWNVDAIRHLMASRSALPIPVADDELLLTVTYLNSKAQPDSLIAKARAPASRGRSSMTSAGRSGPGKRITWIDDARRRGTTHAHVPLSPMTRRPSVERPPSASYSAVRTGPGWVDLMLPRSGARQSQSHTGSAADAMTRPYANGLPHHGDPSRVSSILRVRGSATDHAAAGRRPRSAPAARSPPSATSTSKPRHSESAGGNATASARHHQASMDSHTPVTSSHGKRTAASIPMAAADSGSGQSASRPQSAPAARSPQDQSKPSADETTSVETNSGGVRVSASSDRVSASSASQPTRTQAQAREHSSSRLRPSNSAAQLTLSERSAAAATSSSSSSASSSSVSVGGTAPRSMRGSASAPALPPASGPRSGSAASHHIGVKSAWGSGAAGGDNVVRQHAGGGKPSPDSGDGSGRMGQSARAFGRASRRSNGGGGTATATAGPSGQLVQASSRSRPVSATMPLPEQSTGAGASRGGFPTHGVKDGHTHHTGVPTDAWGVSSAYGSYANGRTARTSHRRRGPTPPPRQRPSSGSGSGSGTGASSMHTGLGEQSHSHGSGPLLAQNGHVSRSRSRPGSAASLTGPVSAPVETASRTTGSLFPPPSGGVAVASRHSSPIIGPGGSRLPRGSGAIGTSSSRAREEADAAAVSRRRGSGFGRSSSAFPSNSNGSSSSLSSTWGPGDRPLEVHERPGWAQSAGSGRPSSTGHPRGDPSSHSHASSSRTRGSRSGSGDGSGLSHGGQRRSSHRASSARRSTRSGAGRPTGATVDTDPRQHQHQHKHQHQHQHQHQQQQHPSSRSSRPFSARPASASRGRAGEPQAQPRHRGSSAGAGGVAGGAFGSVHGAGSSGRSGSTVGRVQVIHGSTQGTRRRGGAGQGYSAGAPYAAGGAGASTMPSGGLAGMQHHQSAYGVTVGSLASDGRSYGRAGQAPRSSLDPVRRRAGGAASHGTSGSSAGLSGYRGRLSDAPRNAGHSMW